MSPAPFRARTLAQRLVGEKTLAYLLHLRPMEWPIMSAHFLLGTLLAVGLNVPLRILFLAWLAFVVLLNGGTLAINSAFDQDEGDIGYLKAPPKPPAHLLAFSVILHIAGVLLAFLLPLPFALIVLACTVMSVLYSVPPVRLKARAGWDLLINCIGFGLLTPLAGWAITGRAFSPAMLWASSGFALLFAALYPMTQIYQVTEDRQRGDLTLVIRMGVGKSLGLALGMAVLAHIFFGCALVAMERSPLPLFLSFLGWLAVILPWLLRWRIWTDAQHEAGMYWGLGAWAVTDLSLLIIMWP